VSANPYKEPSAEARESAKVLFGLFNAMQLEGFTENQALHLLGVMLSASLGNGGSAS
jgi:hypothetical protein